MTGEVAAIQVRSLLASRGQDVSNLRNNRILALIPLALRRLANEVLNTNLLRKTFTVTATDGEAPLATPLTDTEPLILEGLKRASVFIADFDFGLQYKADRASMIPELSTEFGYWTVENQTIVIRDGTGLDNYDGDVTIRNAPYIPTLDTIPVSLDAMFVSLLAELCAVRKVA